MWNHLRCRRFCMVPPSRSSLEMFYICYTYMLAPIYISKWNSNFLKDAKKATELRDKWFNESIQKQKCCIHKPYTSNHTALSWVCSSVSEEVCGTGLLRCLSVQTFMFLSQASYDLLTWDVIWANEVMRVDVTAQKCYRKVNNLMPHWCREALLLIILSSFGKKKCT